ncbi:MAG: murein hydrolase activator EnvC family protein [Nocardioidaceae bacterium]
MKRFGYVAVAVLWCVLSTACFSSYAVASSDEPGPSRRWVWPLHPNPDVVAGFDPPGSDWGAGHRGADLAGERGQNVRAIGAGEVTFAAVLAGRGVVVVDHGGLRSTYEPVTALVSRGEHVETGDVIGRLGHRQSHCSPHTCLHLGLLRGSEYVDPLSVLGVQDVRLKPVQGDGMLAAGQRAPVASGSPEASPASERPTPEPGTSSSTIRVAAGGVAGLATALVLSAALGRRHARG